MQAVNDGFDLVYEGTMFQTLWEQSKRTSAFTWENKNRKHDPFEVHAFGSTVDRVVAPTTREQGKKHVIDSMIEEKKEEESPGSTSQAQKDRKSAIAELEAEKKQTYEELKASLGKSEADELIKQFMVSKP